MTETCAGCLKNLLVYVCVTSQTRYAGAQQTFNARLTHAWDTLLKQYLIKSEHACTVHWRVSNMRRTRSKCIQCPCNAHRTYLKRIRHTPRLRRASRKFLSMFKKFLSRNTHGARSYLQRRISTCTKRTKPCVTRF